MTGTALFRHFKAVLVLLVKRTNLFFIRLDVLEKIRCKHDVLDVDFIGNLELFLIIHPVGPSLLVGNRNLLNVLFKPDGVNLDVALFV